MPRDCPRPEVCQFPAVFLSSATSAMGNLWPSKAPPKELSAAWDRYQEPPKELSAAWDRYQEAPRDPRQSDHLLSELKELLDNFTNLKTNRKQLQDAREAKVNLQSYLSEVKGNSQPKLIQDKKPNQIRVVQVVWDKDKMSEKYQSILRQLLNTIHCREIRQEDLDIDSSRAYPTLYICRTSTGRLEDIDRDKFYDTNDPKALIVLRSGNNESAFPSSYSAGDIVSKETLVVQLLHYDGSLISGKMNGSELEKINKFAKTHGR